MNFATDLAAEEAAERPPAPTTKRVRFVERRELYVDLPAAAADAILATRDITDLVDDYDRMKRVAGSDLTHHSAGDLYVEDATDQLLGTWGDPQPLDGTGREKWLWTARSKVAAARYVLSCARYREGNCTELDEANRDLDAIEERLRVMALAVDGLDPDGQPLDALAALPESQEDTDAHEPITAHEGSEHRAACSCGWQGSAFNLAVDARLSASWHAHTADRSQEDTDGEG